MTYAMSFRPIRLAILAAALALSGCADTPAGPPSPPPPSLACDAAGARAIAGMAPGAAPGAILIGSPVVTAEWAISPGITHIALNGCLTHVSSDRVRFPFYRGEMSVAVFDTDGHFLGSDGQQEADRGDSLSQSVPHMFGATAEWNYRLQRDKVATQMLAHVEVKECAGLTDETCDGKRWFQTLWAVDFPGAPARKVTPVSQSCGSDRDLKAGEAAFHDVQLDIKDNQIRTEITVHGCVRLRGNAALYAGSVEAHILDAAGHEIIGADGKPVQGSQPIYLIEGHDLNVAGDRLRLLRSTHDAIHAFGFTAFALPPVDHARVGSKVELVLKVTAYQRSADGSLVPVGAVAPISRTVRVCRSDDAIFPAVPSGLCHAVAKR